nr:MAG TPA: hypothetical protein [Microviridae sp.]
MQWEVTELPLPPVLPLPALPLLVLKVKLIPLLMLLWFRFSALSSQLKHSFRRLTSMPGRKRPSLTSILLWKRL